MNSSTAVTTLETHGGQKWQQVNLDETNSRHDPQHKRRVYRNVVLRVLASLITLGERLETMHSQSSIKLNRHRPVPGGVPPTEKPYGVLVFEFPTLKVALLKRSPSKTWGDLQPMSNRGSG